MCCRPRCGLLTFGVVCAGMRWCATIASYYDLSETLNHIVISMCKYTLKCIDAMEEMGPPDVELDPTVLSSSASTPAPAPAASAASTPSTHASVAAASAGAKPPIPPSAGDSKPASASAAAAAASAHPTGELFP